MTISTITRSPAGNRTNLVWRLTDKPLESYLFRFYAFAVDTYILLIVYTRLGLWYL